MKPQLKYLGQLLLFACFLLMVYPLIIAFGRTVFPASYMRNVPYPVGGYGHTHTRVSEAETTGKVEILFLGSSHAYRGFDTRIWKARGFTSFNYGTSAQTPLQSELLFTSSLTTLQPKVLIMEVNPILFTNDGVESTLDLIANRPIDMATVCMVYREEHIKTTNALLYGVLRQSIGFDKNLREAAAEDNALYIPGGFVERTKGSFTPEEEAVDKVAEEYATSQIEAFERLLGTAHSAGIQVLLIEAPVTNFVYGKMQQPQRQFESFMDFMAANSKFLNMNGKVALSDSLHFSDGHHLNQAGVELFNAALIDTLIGRGWLPRNRSNEIQGNSRSIGSPSDGSIQQ
ncbi:MAG: hypothetical protein KA408_09890 [Flavobacteriales bacterium]|nr:hypothetical protein [Flavobacteriales bacterium]